MNRDARDARDSDEIIDAKRVARAHAKTTIASLDADARAHGSDVIRARLLADPRIATARTLLAFLPLADEPDILPLLLERRAAGAIDAVPTIDAATGSILPIRLGDGDPNDEADFPRVALGVREPRERVPVPLASIDAVLVPGLGFDADGARLGRGGGFYDRLLAELPRRIPRIGVAFAIRMLDRVPVGRHDERVDAVVTDAP